MLFEVRSLLFYVVALGFSVPRTVFLLDYYAKRGHWMSEKDVGEKRRSVNHMNPSMRVGGFFKSMTYILLGPVFLFAVFLSAPSAKAIW
jgi:hypothetical protein